MESPYVSAHINEWIDLVFGFRQQGRKAEEVCNVFVHLTYEGAVDLASISNPREREATQAQIEYFGQVPLQLFRRPHPSRSALGSGRLLQSTVDQLLLRNKDRVGKVLAAGGAGALARWDRTDAKLNKHLNNHYEQAEKTVNNLVDSTLVKSQQLAGNAQNAVNSIISLFKN